LRAGCAAPSPPPAGSSRTWHAGSERALRSPTPSRPQLGPGAALASSPLLALPTSCSAPARSLLPEPLFPLDSCGCSPLSPSPLPMWRPQRVAAARVLPLGGGAAAPTLQQPVEAGRRRARALLTGAFPSPPPAGAAQQRAPARPPRRVRLPGVPGPAAAPLGAPAAVVPALPPAVPAAAPAALAAPPPAGAPAPAAAVAPRRIPAKRSRPPAGSGAAAASCDSPDAKRRPVARLLTRPHGLGCVECGATSTPVWRSGPAGPKTLCNRCGVRLSKLARRKL
jgi:hypothetical protein